MTPLYSIDEVPTGEKRFVVTVRYGESPSTECGRFKTKAEAQAWTEEQRRKKGY